MSVSNTWLDEQTLVIVIAGVCILAIVLRGALFNGLKSLVHAAVVMLAIGLCAGIGFALWRQHQGGPPVKETLSGGMEVVGEAVRGTIDEFQSQNRDE